MLQYAAIYGIMQCTLPYVYKTQGNAQRSAAPHVAARGAAQRRAAPERNATQCTASDVNER